MKKTLLTIGIVLSLFVLCTYTFKTFPGKTYAENSHSKVAIQDDPTPTPTPDSSDDYSGDDSYTPEPEPEPTPYPTPEPDDEDSSDDYY